MPSFLSTGTQLLTRITQEHRFQTSLLPMKAAIIMPYSISWEPKGIYASFSGFCSVADVLRAFEDISNDPRSDHFYYAIFDYLAVEQENISEAEIEIEIEDVAAFDIGLTYSLPNLRFASITTDERIIKLWRHYFSVHAFPEKLAIFSTLSSAREWLENSPKTYLIKQGF